MKFRSGDIGYRVFIPDFDLSEISPNTPLTLDVLGNYTKIVGVLDGSLRVSLADESL